MDESTTTDAPVDSGAVQTVDGVPIDAQGSAIAAQPDEPTEPAEAVPEASEPEQEETPAPESKPSEEEAPAANEDEQLTKWAENKGLKLDSEDAKKAAKMARDAEKAMHQKAQRASELEKATKIKDEDIPLGASNQEVDNLRIRNVELRQDIRDWKVDNQDKLAHEAEMVKVLQDPVKRQLVQSGYLSLDDVYSIAVGNDPAKEADLKSQGKQEALKSLAHRQQAATPTGDAVTPTASTPAITPQNVDQLVGSHDLAWYEKNLDAINKAMAG